MIFAFHPVFARNHHAEAERTHEDHPDVNGGVLEKLHADPFEEEDVLAEPGMTAKLVKELVVDEGKQVGDHLPHHLLLGGGNVPEGKEEDSGGGKDYKLEPAFWLKQPAVGADEELEELHQDEDDQEEGDGNKKDIVDGVQ